MKLQESWYKKLLEDLKKLEFSGIILTKWNVGKRLEQDIERFGKPEYGSKRMENLAKDLQTSVSELTRCRQLCKKFHTVKELEEATKEYSWHYIANNMLPKERKPKTPTPPVPKGKYNIVYADPPWDYFAGGYKNQSQHYDGMPTEDICHLPITDLADENCVLFMWVTFPMLDEFMDVVRCWGFEYSTVAFVWVKSKSDKTGFAYGCGNWTRANAEICILAVRGKNERQDASISQIIYEPKEKHSKKPDIVRDKIIQLVGDLPRIELFAREKVEGWDSWGNEV